jgi:hypothetical protein
MSVFPRQKWLNLNFAQVCIIHASKMKKAHDSASRLQEEASLFSALTDRKRLQSNQEIAKGIVYDKPIHRKY